jgi:thermitase
VKQHLPTIIFATVLLLMAFSLGWLAMETTHTPKVAKNDAPELIRRPKVVTKPSPPPEIATREQNTPPPQPQVQLLNVPGALPNEALLTFRTPEALAAFRDRSTLLGLEVLGHDIQLSTARVRFRDTAGLEHDLNEHANDYTHVGPNYLVRIPGLPEPVPQTDTANAGGAEPFRSQGLEAIGASGNRNGWGQGVTVAVIDSGIAAHPSLKDVQITHIDLVNDGSQMNGHGTAMASLIAGNDTSVSGVAPAAKLLDIRVADTHGDSNTALLSSAIVKATDLGARVINVSLGSSSSSRAAKRALHARRPPRRP